MALRANEAITRASAKVLGLQTAPVFGDGHLHNGLQALLLEALIAVGCLKPDTACRQVEFMAVGTAQTIPGVFSKPQCVNALQTPLARLFLQALQQGLALGSFVGIGNQGLAWRIFTGGVLFLFHGRGLGPSATSN